MTAGKRFLASEATKEEIAAKVKECLESRQEICFAQFHGSFLGSGPFRDVDIAVYLEPGYVGLSEPSDRFDYEASLEDLIERRVGVPVDVRVLNDAPLAFCYGVLKNGCPVLVRNPQLRCDFQTRILDMYFDFAPFRSRYLREVLGREA
ncbi:MAG: nucleotidyltransferase domain-containing protein [Bacillota bacterium]